MLTLHRSCLVLVGLVLAVAVSSIEARLVDNLVCPDRSFKRDQGCEPGLFGMPRCPSCHDVCAPNRKLNDDHEHKTDELGDTAVACCCTKQLNAIAQLQTNIYGKIFKDVF